MKKLEKSVPVIRFKGFSEAWEQRKLRDFTKISQGLQIAISDRYLENGDNRELYITNEFLNTYSSPKYYIENPPENVIANEDDILMTRTGNTGKVITNVIGAFHNNFFKIDYNPMKTSKLFLYYVLVSENIQKEILIKAGTSTIPDLKHNDFYSIVIQVPKIQEQQKIGDFFKQLDNTIALHQRKLDTLKLMKKGFLQQMFPNNDEEIPKVRFADFNGMWKQRKLNSITEKITRKNKELESTLPLTISAQDGLIDQNEYFNKIIASRNIRGYFLVKNGEFAYNKSYSKGYPWGVVKRLDNYNMGVLSTLYIIFKPVKINSDFLTKYFDSTYWYRAVSQFATEGARNHGLLNIAASDFFEIELNIPLNNEEQKKIGLFFQQLENIIILHQNKLEKLSILKKTYLKKMFI
ncbi:restriction endonuclease subunit S [Listeria monocytogenes]|uniref:restriction endonuclease subunit S n=1 Tax=Listeria monocytogenes TaxID=1639 RepID=UPI0010D99EB0|nr:restriction endonuclease subunit S [Listeria monocytogenes]EHN0476958.1 restriction endonuclease subunit S [Listeria monocytogenes]EHX0500696.1 restriction endonuclease subunit S [Listeria monocytogenes]EIM0219466.1 restriction endonuclease subunit S [Listeria monocytogenes]EIM0407030.1 restriction endonuclease subunit S [Listeria monocytogenes]